MEQSINQPSIEDQTYRPEASKVCEQYHFTYEMRAF